MIRLPTFAALHRSLRFALAAYCVFSVALACGSSEALHDLGHRLAATARESEPTSSSETPAASAHENCWIHDLASSVSHHAPTPPGTSGPICRSFVALEAVPHVSVTVRSVDVSSSSSRGPPATEPAPHAPQAPSAAV